MRRLISATLLLYPRHVRRRHGAEMQSLITDMIERDGASRPAVVTRLAADGLAQRLTSRTTAWVVGITVLITSLGGLAVSDFAAASAHRRPRIVDARSHRHQRAVGPRRVAAHQATDRGKRASGIIGG